MGLDLRELGKSGGSRPGSASFPDPTTIPNLVVWLDPAAVYVTLSGSLGVTWTSRDASAHVLNNAGGTTRPTWEASGLLGKPCWLFSGTQYFRQFVTSAIATAITARTAFTWFTVFTFNTSTTAFRTLAAANSNSTGVYKRMYVEDILIKLKYAATGSGTGQTTNTSTLSPVINVPSLAVHMYDGTNTFLRLDEVQQSTGTNTQTSAPTVYTCGARGIGGLSNTDFHRGRIAEQIGYNRLLSASEISTVEAYLGNKYPGLL